MLHRTLARTGRTCLATLSSAAIAGATLLALTAGPAQATGFNSYTGTWNNTDNNTRGIVRIEISGNPNNVTVHAYGACSPNPCDWGSTRGFAYGRNVSSNVGSDTDAITAIFRSGHSETLLTISVNGGGNQLSVRNYTRFTDGSGRSGYTGRETFRKRFIATPLPTPIPTPIPIPTPMPMPMPSPGAGIGAEDCVSLNPNNVQARNVGGRWKAVDGNHLLLDFGANMAEAHRAVSIIRQYRMDEHCFVGRPNPSMDYWLRGHSAPAGNLPGEDCVGFNPANVTVGNFGGRWKIIEGSHWIMDFGGNQAEANKALRVIKHYGFTKSCFVGRPNPSMTYLRR